MKPFNRLAIAFVLGALGSSSLQAKGVAEYQGRYLVLLRDGLAVGLCTERAPAAGRHGHPTTPPLKVRIEGDKADFRPEAGFLAAMTQCGTVTPEPLRVGEILRVGRTGYRRNTLYLMVETVSLHSVTRSGGLYPRMGKEPAAAEFDLPDCRPTPDACRAVAARWFRAFPSRAEASRFAGAKAAPAVRQVKAGMTFAEVEAALGPPVTKIDLGSKVLYKYPDLTVEFHDGKVADAQ